MKSMKGKQRHHIPLAVLRLVFLPRLTIHWSLPPPESMTFKLVMVKWVIVVRHRYGREHIMNTNGCVKHKKLKDDTHKYRGTYVI